MNGSRASDGDYQHLILSRSWKGASVACEVVSLCFFYHRVTASGNTAPINSSNSVNTKCVLRQRQYDPFTRGTRDERSGLTSDADYSA